MDCTRIFAYIAGTVDQQLRLSNEYPVAENRILKAQLKTRLRLTNKGRVTLAEIAHRLGRKALGDIAITAKPDPLMDWFRRVVAQKFDGFKSRRYSSGPKIDAEIEQFVVRMAKENSDWGYGRIVGALSESGYTLSEQTFGNILQRHGFPPAPKRQHTTTWADFICTHMAEPVGTNFFSVGVLAPRGLVTCYVSFFIYLERRKVKIAGMIAHLDEARMKQIVRNVSMNELGFFGHGRNLIHARDTKYGPLFRKIIDSGDVAPIELPAQRLNLNALSESGVKSVKEEWLSKVILFGESFLRSTLRDYLANYHAKRNSIRDRGCSFDVKSGSMAAIFTCLPSLIECLANGRRPCMTISAGVI